MIALDLQKLRKKIDFRDFLLLGILFVAFHRYFHYLISYVGDRFLNLDVRWFVERWQLDSDMSIRLRLNSSLNDGLFSHLLSLGEHGSYFSQVGLGGWLLTVPVYGLHKFGILNLADYSLPAPSMGLSGSIGLFGLYTVTAVVNAVIVFAVVKWLKVSFSSTAALFFLIGIFQPWSLAVQSSLFWLIGIKLLPALAAALVICRFKDGVQFLGSVIFSTSLIAYLSGYEFATLIFIAPVAVITYVSISSGWDKRFSLILYSKSIVAGLASFFVALCIHFTQLYLKFGNTETAKSEFIRVISKRTGVTKEDFGVLYEQSLSSNPLDVLNTYLSMPVFGAPYKILILGNFNVLSFIILTLIVCLISPKLINNSAELRNYTALGAAWLVSLLAPIGWFLLARPHSFGHTHINFVLWFLPTIPLGFALLAMPFRIVLSQVRRSKEFLAMVGFVFIVIAVMTIFSYITRLK